MLSQSLRHLQELQSQTNSNDTEPSEANHLLRALWRRHSRELHYVAHYQEPLVVEVGDIGYVTGNPPQFICLENVDYEFPGLMEIRSVAVKKSRFTPKGRWRSQEIDGVIR